jgi:DeoR/GlpR family transcriptional regulator of sugar metabolism
MRIFLSHSSRHKPLVREVKNCLPEHIKAWIDEKELLVGDDIEISIKTAIQADSDFVVLFLDSNAMRSQWVRKELEWAIEQEAALGRSFIIPVLLDRDVWETLEPETFRRRKYIPCDDFTEEGIKGIASALSSQLFAWVSRDLTLAKNTLVPDSPLKFLDDADRYLEKLASEVRLTVQPYFRDAPLSLDKLFEILNSRRHLGLDTEEKFTELLVRLRRRGCLAGLVFDGQSVFIEEEHYGWKTTVRTDVKQAIARKAISFIHAGSTIILDAGSTTIEIARQISSGLKMHLWNSLNIVTNSVPAANQILVTAAELGFEDRNREIQVYVIGGRVRPNTLAVVNDDTTKCAVVLADILTMMNVFNSADIAFVGTNGIYRDLGFTTHDVCEAMGKAAMLNSAKRRIVTTDPSKFGVRQASVFATFDQPIEIITIREGCEKRVDEYEGYFKDTSIKIIYAT